MHFKFLLLLSIFFTSLSFANDTVDIYQSTEQTTNSKGKIFKYKNDYGESLKNSSSYDRPKVNIAYDDLKLNSWYVSCRKKEFDGSKICSLHSDDLWIYYINGKYSVSVGSNHYPRTKAGLRIDNSKAIYGYEGDFSNSLTLISQLKNGKFAYTRYQEWPYLYQIDKKTDLSELNEKLNEMLKQYKEL